MGDKKTGQECICSCKTTVAVSVLLTILIVGAGCFLIFSWQLKHINKALDTHNNVLNQQITDLHDELVPETE